MQSDGGRKFKVGTGREEAKEREREILQVSGEGLGRGLHLALNSGHDGWFPDVIHWNCAAPSRRLMKTHASSGASQMILGPSALSPPCIRSACRCVRFRSIVHANGVHVSPRPRSFPENSRISTNQPLQRFSSCLSLSRKKTWRKIARIFMDISFSREEM